MIEYIRTTFLMRLEKNGKRLDNLYVPQPKYYLIYRLNQYIDISL